MVDIFEKTSLTHTPESWTLQPYLPHCVVPITLDAGERYPQKEKKEYK